MPAAHADADLEALLGRHGLDYRLALVSISEIDWRASSAAQIRPGGIDDQAVERYAAAIEAGDILPAGFGTVTTGRWTVIGGQHRAHGYRKALQEKVPMYAVEGDPREIWLAAVEHNTRHGLPLPNAARAQLAMTMVDDYGLTVNDASRIAGIHPVNVSKARSMREASARANRLGISSLWSTLSAAIRYRLGTGTKAHSDDVFRETVNIANQCAITKPQADKLGAALKEAPDEDQAMEVLAEFEIGWHPGMASTRGGKASATSLRNHAMAICDLDPEEVAASISLSFIEPTSALLKRAAKRIAECAVAIEGVTQGP